MSSSKVFLPSSSTGERSKMRVMRDPAIRVRQAVRDNNVTLLQRLQQNVDLRNTDRNRLTSLSWAAIEGSLEVFEWLLLDYGHDDQELSRDSDNNTILHLLASTPNPPRHILNSSPLFPPRAPTKPISAHIQTSLRMTELYHQLFPFLLDWSNSAGKTALHLASQSCNHAFISLLCDLGADIDLTDLQGNTPLHYAAAWGHLEVIRILLERGCSFGARNSEGYTASEFSYSARVLAEMQGIAREVRSQRSRAGSASLGLGGGGAGAALVPPAFPFPEVGVGNGNGNANGNGYRSTPVSRRPSESQVSISPPQAQPKSMSNSMHVSPSMLSTGTSPSLKSTDVSPRMRPDLYPQSTSPSSYSYSAPPALSHHSKSDYTAFPDHNRSTQPSRSPSIPPSSPIVRSLVNTTGLSTAPGPPLLPGGSGTTYSPLMTSSGTLPPAPYNLGPVSMRRVNSSQTDSGMSAGTGVERSRAHRAGSGASGRGTPI